jgi:7tm Chemosensory receptor
MAINDYLNDTKAIFIEKKFRRVNAIGPNLRKDNLFIGNISFLEREIRPSRNMKIKDAWTLTGNRVSDVNTFPVDSRGIINVAPYETGTKGERVRLDGLIDCLSRLRFPAPSVAITKSIMTDDFHLNDGRDFSIGDRMDKKLINLCRAHDEICEIAKQVNRMFSFQMLITMAYGFLSITAQCYFLYCGLISEVCA